MKRTPAAGRRVRALLAGLAAALILLPAHAQEGLRDERAVRAAYVFNLIKYVEWPSQGRELTIALIGDAETGGVMASMLDGRTSNGKNIHVVLSPSDEALENCGVLYIAASRPEDIRYALERMKGRSVLTVGETDGFVRGGGMVALINTGDHIRIEVNLDAVQRAGIRISSRVLNLAIIVRPAQNGGN